MLYPHAMASSQYFPSSIAKFSLQEFELILVNVTFAHVTTEPSSLCMIEIKNSSYVNMCDIFETAGKFVTFYSTIISVFNVVFKIQDFIEHFYITFIDFPNAIKNNSYIRSYSVRRKF